MFLPFDVTKNKIKQLSIDEMISQKVLVSYIALQITYFWGVTMIITVLTQPQIYIPNQNFYHSHCFSFSYLFSYTKLKYSPDCFPCASLTLFIMHFRWYIIYSILSCSYKNHIPFYASRALYFLYHLLQSYHPVCFMSSSPTTIPLHRVHYNNTSSN